MRKNITLAKATKEERLEFREIKKRQGFFSFVNNPKYWWEVFEKDKITRSEYYGLLIELGLFNLFGSIIKVQKEGLNDNR